LLALAILVLQFAPTADAESEIAARIPAGTAPLNVAVNALTNRVYVPNFESNSVTVINGATNQPITSIMVDPQPVGIAVNPMTNKIYVSSRATNRVKIIDGATVTLGGQLHLEPFLHVPPSGATTAAFSVQRETAGVPATVHSTVKDSCGEWPSFVGDGPKAGF
jgi:YVTN family beta-propeller protein